MINHDGDQPDFLKTLNVESDSKEELNTFTTYDASFFLERLNSSSPDSARKWVRKNSFFQLVIALEMYKLDYATSLSSEQIQAVDSFQEFASSIDFKAKDLVEKEDIQKALIILELLGFDVSVQMKQLNDTWK